MDADEKKIAIDESPYRLNVERAINNQNQSMGGSLGLKTPHPGNRHLPVDLPGGINNEIRSWESKKTGETYVWVHNSEQQHSLYRINQDTTVQLVFRGPELELDLDPKHMPRPHLFFNNNSFITPLNKKFHKYLIYTTGRGWQKMIDTETSIATNSFTVGYFNTPDRKVLVQLPTRPSLKCVTATLAPVDDAQPSALNKIIKKTWQWRIKGIYTDGRPTSWGPISSTYLVEVSPCQLSAEGLPTCWLLKIDAMNPLVEKIVIAFRNCAGNFTDNQDPDWNEYDTIEKYDLSADSTVPFYNRAIRNDLGYDANDNTFTYKFCGNKKCVPIDKRETNLNFIDIPITTFALAPLDDRLLLVNNEKGENPIDRNVLANLTFRAEEPVIKQCTIEMVTVKFAVIIHNFGVGLNEFIYILPDDNDNWDKNRKFFGGLGPRRFLSSPLDDVEPYNQFFTDLKQSGFIVYVEGTPYYGITKQYRVFNQIIDTQEAKIGNMSAGFIQRRRSEELTDQDYYFIQTGEVKVPKGLKGFLRMASHLAPRTSQFQDTSTTVRGIMTNRLQYSARNNGIGMDKTSKEIYFDTCAGAVDLTNRPFVVEDLTAPYSTLSFGDAATAQSGYLKDKDGRPVSRAQVVPFGAMGTEGSIVTDHNGFYYNTMYFEGLSLSMHNDGVEFLVEHTGCQKVKLADAILGSGARPNEVVVRNPVISQDTYNQNFYATIDVLVKDVNGVPIPGISVAVTGAKSRITNANGIARLFIRNEMIQYGSPYTVRIIVMQSGLCYLTIGNCNGCMPSVDVTLPVCLNGPVSQSITTLPAFNAIAPTKGLQPGGLYPFAVKFIDAAGRETFAQGDYQLQLPSIQEKQAHQFSRVRWDIAGVWDLPRQFVKMAILVGKNRLWDDWTEWIVDKIEFVDNAGNPATNVSADKIRLSIKSLYAGQRKYNLNTNVKYQFVPGDKLQFIANYDGKIFSNPVQDLTFSIDGDYNNREAVLKEGETENDDRFSFLLIDYSKLLQDIQAGALIRIFNESKCLTEDFFYESCPLIDLVDGEPVQRSGYVSTFDSYFVRRVIEFDDMAHTFTFPFLHHSPSDFWGDHCIDRGRVSVRNAYEKKIRYGRSAMVSQVFLENGNFNGLNMYSRDLEKIFSGEQRGDITMAISIEQVIMIICEYDQFMARVADDFVRVGSDNILKALAAEAVMGDAEVKIRGFYGCQYPDVKSVLVGEGWVWWFDRYRACPVIHDFQEAKNAGLAHMESYFLNKVQTIKGYQNLNIVSGYDPVARQILLTFFSKDPGAIDDSYVHSRPQVEYTRNETIAFSLIDQRFYTFYSFTPEGYGTLMNSPQGNVFICFKEGQPYLHRERNTIKFNEFFGRAVDQVLEFVVNENKDKVKKYLAMQVQTTIPFFADRIQTSEGQVSIIPPIAAQLVSEGKTDNKFLCDLNSPGSLYQGHPLLGFWMKVRLVRQNSTTFIIGSSDPAKQVLYSELDSILVKFMWSEQSAYGTGNS